MEAAVGAEPGVLAVEFDFESKQSRVIAALDAATSCARGLSCWIDIDVAATSSAGAEVLLRSLGLDERAVRDAVHAVDEDGRHELHEDCIVVTVPTLTLVGLAVRRSPLNLLVSEHHVVTLHRGPTELVDGMRRTYLHDFERYARTLSFVVFEAFDHLLDGHRRTLRAITREVEVLQGAIFGDLGDGIFDAVARARTGLLTFRAGLLATRGVVHELATRRTPFISESSRPFLADMVDTLERLAADIAVEREVLGEALDLYMGIVAHRTNRVVNRLTALSAVFLPLTFLCGVYGMNFDEIPELHVRHGYLVFWVVAGSLAVGLPALMRRLRWI
jgi:magnesium transporter